MACCAFAVFILGQIYVAWEAIVRVFGIKPATKANSSAVDWYAGAITPAPARTALLKLPPVSKRLAIAAATSVLALSVALLSRSEATHLDAAINLADPAHICGASAILGN